MKVDAVIWPCEECHPRLDPETPIDVVGQLRANGDIEDVECFLGGSVWLESCRCEDERAHEALVEKVARRGLRVPA